MKKGLVSTVGALCPALMMGLSALVPAATAAPAATWDAADFTIETEGASTTLRGLSDTGLQKITSLKHVVIPEGVTALTGPNGRTGNMHSKGITGITLPATLTEVSYGFLDRNAISAVEFPAGMQKIGPAAFQANALTEVTLPASITEVAWSAFQNNHISTVRLAGTYNNAVFPVVPGSSAGNSSPAFAQQELADATVPAHGTLTLARISDVNGDLSGRGLTWDAYYWDDGAAEPALTSSIVTFADGTVTGVAPGSTRVIMMANDTATGKPLYSAVVRVNVTEPAPEPDPVPDPDPAPNPQPQPDPDPAPNPQPQPNPDPAPNPQPQPADPTSPSQPQGPKPQPAPKPAPKPEANKPAPAPSKAPTRQLAHTGLAATGALAAMAVLLPTGYALRRRAK
ncbi:MULTISPECIES: leucine-rich repeat protein [Actinotignum]|uniref:Leucine-rich repeat protein n=1 Tax=Actinotignum timonense TaxID=1870995 RepID=A0AAW9HKY2_9ACTO|nr:MULTISPECIES: leucine-rich repeat protein [Actinotignum]MDE1559251.1 leucine-rich repeat protein [Actinotignum schaalii]MDE1664230.1 leucine-rich repeat protein [Actinotignum schaalii]MDK6373683.1 leucine-rich repeat protein [Actinotignum timonense]MDK6419377.1 leucine-rich repeat protein [Actinotignum timonense]MDK6590999.1 leucine-rich repeat protein [Actinotignum timonense]